MKFVTRRFLLFDKKEPSKLQPLSFVENSYSIQMQKFHIKNIIQVGKYPYILFNRLEVEEILRNNNKNFHFNSVIFQVLQQKQKTRKIFLNFPFVSLFCFSFSAVTSSLVFLFSTQRDFSPKTICKHKRTLSQRKVCIFPILKS